MLSTSLTVKVTLSLMLVFNVEVAVIVAFPPLRAVMVPLEETLMTLALELDHETL